MQSSRVVKNIIGFCLFVMLSACGGGGGGDTNGNLTMEDIIATDLGGGNYSVETNATYIPTGGKDPQGLEINFYATFATSSQSTTRSASVTIGTSGAASVGPWAVTQVSEPIIVTIRSSVGDLAVVKQIAVPAISPLSVSPAAIAFTNAEGIGTTKNVTITGGYSPYLVVSDVPTDVSVQLTGSTVTLTKLVNVSATPVSASANIIITDNKGGQVTVPVGYFK